jgi:hypothetical protein
MLSAGSKYFMTDAWFHLTGYVNSRNSQYWATENPHIINEQNVRVGCALSGHRIVFSFFHFLSQHNQHRRIPANSGRNLCPADEGWSSALLFPAGVCYVLGNIGLLAWPCILVRSQGLCGLHDVWTCDICLWGALK